MIYENLNNILMTSMKGEVPEAFKQDSKLYLEVVKAIKTEMVNEVHNGVHLPDMNEEVRILRSMIKKRQSAAEMYMSVSKDRAMKELQEAKIIEGFLPAIPSADEVVEETNCVIKNFLALKSLTDHGEFDGNLMKYTKDIIAKVKEKYPLAENGQIVSTIKNYK